MLAFESSHLRTIVDRHIHPVKQNPFSYPTQFLETVDDTVPSTWIILLHLQLSLRQDRFSVPHPLTLVIDYPSPDVQTGDTVVMGDLEAAPGKLQGSASWVSVPALACTSDLDNTLS